jgi:hypothetical protein
MNGQEVTTRSSVSVSLTLNTLPQLREFCQVLAKTSMVPKAYIDRPDDILVAMLHGQEIGLPHLQALQSVAVVNGIPSIYGDAALALVRSSGKLEDFDEYILVDGLRQDGPFPILKYAEEGRSIVAYCMSKRIGMSRERVTTYSVDDAQRAKLWLKKGNNGFETPWCTVPQRMLMWRARGWNLRDNFGDVLKGLAIYEEAMDIEVSRGNDGVYRAPVEIPADQSDAEMKRIQDLMNLKTVEQDGASVNKGGAVHDPSESVMSSKTSDAAPPQTGEISEEDWANAVGVIEADQNLDVLKKVVMANMKIKKLKLYEHGKREFIRQFRIECEKEGLLGQFKQIFG